MSVVTHRITLDTKYMIGLSHDARQQQVVQEKMLDDLGSTIAERLKKRMQDVLDPSHKYEVGASGKAAASLYVKRTGGAGGQAAWEIFEGKEEARYIRQGRKPKSTPPPTSAIVEWILAKPGMASRVHMLGNKPRMTKYGGRRANLRSRPGRAFMKDIRVIARIIALSIGARGANLSHKNLRPKGQPRYDYPQDIMRNEYLAETPLVRAPVEGTLSAVVEYLLTGRYGGRIKTSFKFFNN